MTACPTCGACPCYEHERKTMTTPTDLDKQKAERRQDTRDAWNDLLGAFTVTQARAIESFVTAVGNEDRLTFSTLAPSAAPEVEIRWKPCTCGSVMPFGQHRDGCHNGSTQPATEAKPSLVVPSPNPTTLAELHEILGWLVSERYEPRWYSNDCARIFAAGQNWHVGPGKGEIRAAKGRGTDGQYTVIMSPVLLEALSKSAIYETREAKPSPPSETTHCEHCGGKLPCTYWRCHALWPRPTRPTISQTETVGEADCHSATHSGNSAVWCAVCGAFSQNGEPWQQSKHGARYAPLVAEVRELRAAGEALVNANKRHFDLAQRNHEEAEFLRGELAAANSRADGMEAFLREHGSVIAWCPGHHSKLVADLIDLKVPGIDEESLVRSNERERGANDKGV